MDANSSNVGFSDAPPRADGARDNPKKEEQPSPPPDSPVYTVRRSDDSNDSGRGGIILKKTAVMLAGLVAVVAILLAGTYYYRSDIGAALQTGLSGTGTELTALEIEVVRTLRALDELSVEFSDDPEKLKEIELMKKETRNILESIGGGTE